MERLQLKAISRHDTRLYNKVFRKNSDLFFTWQDEQFQLKFSPLVHSYSPVFGLEISAGDFNFRLGLDHIFFMDEVNELLSDADILKMPESLRTAVLEAVFEDLLNRFDAWGGGPSKIRKVIFQSSFEDREHVIFFTLTRQSNRKSVKGHLCFNAEALQWLADLFDRIPAEHLRNWDGLPVPARFEIGKTQLAFRELKQIQKHDIILLDECALGPVGGAVWVRVSQAIAFAGILDKNKVTIENLMEDPMADEEITEKQSAREEVAISVEDIPVDLVFELGQKIITLADLKDLQPGYTFELEKNLEKPVSIRANGKIIGAGELVQIDEQIGVRILEVFEDAGG